MWIRNTAMKPEASFSSLSRLSFRHVRKNAF
jgi:hypothetical protein